MKTQLAVFDLDKTLLNDDGSLPASFATDLQQLEALQVQFAIATTRPYSSMRKLFGSLLPKICGVCDNGNVLFCGEETKIIYRFSWEEVQRLVKLAQEEVDFAVAISGNGRGFADALSVKKFRAAGILAYLPPLHDIQELARGEIIVSGINLYCLQQQVFDEAMKQKLQQSLGDFSLREAGYGWLAVLPPGVDKAKGVGLLLQKLHIHPRNAICFGDSENDIPLFQLLPHSFAMRNATDYVQACATGVTDFDNNANGAMLKALAYFGERPGIPQDGRCR